MSLARETCVFVSAAYRLGLVLEDLRDACDPSGTLSSPHKFRKRIEECIDGLGGLLWTTEHLPGTTELHKKLWFFREAIGPASSSPTVNGWGQIATDTLSGLQKHVAARVGPRLRDQLDALLVLLLVEQRERGRQKLRLAIDFAPWIGVDGSDMLEIIGARALQGLLHVKPPDPSLPPRAGVTPLPTVHAADSASVRLTIDGSLFAESLLEGDAEPGHAPTLQTDRERPVAAPARIEGSIERLEIQNIFSFGDEAEPIEMGRLNLLIGANGAGKSNILEAIELLASTPRDVQAAIREAGGIYDVLSRRSRQEGLVGTVEAVIRFAHRDDPLLHRLRFAAEEQRFSIVDERIENVDAHNRPTPFFFFGHEKRGPMISTWNEADQQRRLEPVRMPATRSILSERRDPERYPELAGLAGFYEGLRAYREPLLGRFAAPRTPQATDLPNDQLRADGSNLALVLGRLRLDPPTMRSIVEKLRDVYASVNDIETKTEGGTIQVFLQDNGFPLSARRISDGTMRFLCLLVVLCDPSPPPVVLIEEPELGLHPDAIGALADLLRDASERMQLIVTTHSEALVDRFGDTPEVVLVIDKAEPIEGGSTRARRLDRENLKEWLDTYSLGRLWRMGELGGNRW
jgi:predicted ATPase